jgi:hypothetical protein
MGLLRSDLSLNILRGTEYDTKRVAHSIHVYIVIYEEMKKFI